MREFREAILEGDVDRVIALLADDVVFRGPVVYEPYEGRARVEQALRGAKKVIKDFAYTREIGAPGAGDHALVFRARIGDRNVEGCDFVHLNDEGLIDELYVMVRPLSAVTALAERMGRELASAEGDSA